MEKINRRELLGTAIPAVLGTAAVATASELPAAVVGTKAISMGIGELGNSKNIFVREFRFLFWFDHMGPGFNHSIAFDRVKKEIKFKNYEISQDGVVSGQHWIDAMLNNEFPNETMIFATYDGCGQEIYRKRFTGLKIKSCISSFNASSSECARPEVCLSYEDYEDVSVGSEKRQTCPKAVQIDHLNVRSWIL